MLRQMKIVKLAMAVSSVLRWYPIS